MFLNPGTLTAHNDKKIATDFSFLKDDKKQAVYSLMPMANDIRCSEIPKDAKRDFYKRD
jgi:hypothetical protein